MTTTRRLLLLRHARTEDARPGGVDASRRLTDQGVEQARQVGEHLRSESIAVDQVLCSTAERARQTLEAMMLEAPVEHREDLYNAGADTVIEVIRQQPESSDTLLLVGHAPAIASVAYELADPETSTGEAVQAIDGRFPAGTLAVLEVDGDWSSLEAVRLVSVRLP